MLLEFLLSIMVGAESVRSKGLTIILANDKPAIQATVRGVREAFPLKEQRTRNFVVVRELSENAGQKPINVQEQIETLLVEGSQDFSLSMFDWYTGPFVSMDHLRKYAHISDETFRAIAPHVLIVALHQPEENHHWVPTEKLTLHRAFLDAQRRADRIIQQNEALPEPVNYDIALGMTNVYFPFPGEDLHMICIFAKDKNGLEVRATSVGGAVEDHVIAGDLHEREELLIHPIAKALQNIQKLRDQEENA